MQKCLRTRPKGQIISKWFFGVFDFLQKTNENMLTLGIIVVKSNFFVGSLEEIEDTKNPLKIVWPLTVISKFFTRDTTFRQLAFRHNRWNFPIFCSQYVFNFCLSPCDSIIAENSSLLGDANIKKCILLMDLSHTCSDRDEIRVQCFPPSCFEVESNE